MNNMGREIMAALKRFQTGSDGDGVTVGGALVVSGATTVNTFNVDVISEKTSAAGVTVDGVLLKDSGVVVADGSASAPAVTNTGDTNTGLYFPAADEVAVAAGGSVAAAFNSHQFMGMRNRIINGDMRIDQRNAGASVTPSDGQYTLDRWLVETSQSSKFSVQQNAGSVTPPAGFTNYLGVTSLSAYSPVSTDYMWLSQRIEGFNVADLGFGTANAKTITLSFWVRSSLTGSFGASISNIAARVYPFNYTISSADTWEYKTVTIAGDTSGTWNTGNGSGMRIQFNLGTGSNRLGTSSAWGSTDYRGGLTGATSVVGTDGATFYITGVQLEVGSVATPFERRPFGTELALCQRYCYRQTQSTSNEVGLGPRQATQYIKWYVVLPVTMRAAPTWANPPTSYVSSLSASGQVTAYNFNAAATYTITGTLSTLNQVNVNGGGLYLEASTSFDGSAGDFSGIAMYDGPLFSAEL
jgi:hypothetical protein